MGSFSAAARSLRLPNTTVSRRVRELEARLGVQLVHRTTRKLGLSGAGVLYYQHCKHLSQDLELAENAVAELHGGPRGWLRFTAPFSVGAAWIAPLLGEFQSLHPDVRMEMQLASESLNLIHNGIDVALRLGRLADSTLVARRLALLPSRIYAANKYLERFGEPSHPEELGRHRVLASFAHRRSFGYAWPLGDGGKLRDVPIEPALVANDPGALKGALISGEGLLLVSDLTAKDAIEKGQIKHVLADWRGPDLEFNAVFQGGRLQPPKVRAFVDFLVERINFEASYMERRCSSAHDTHKQGG